MTTYESGAGSIVHVEFASDDLEATRAFVEEAFGWETETVEEMDGYVIWRAPNPPGGGLVAPGEAPFTPPPTAFYIDVPDLDETREAIVAAGGELIVDEMAVDEMGVFCVYEDPGGVVAAAWEDRSDGEPPEGGWPTFTDDPEAGSITHFELYTEDPAATREFHEAVFGWAFESIDGGAYTMVHPPTPPYGGVMEATDEMPAGVLAYLLVAGAEDVCRDIEAAGGRILREPYEIEGWGTMAVFEAPGGFVGAVWEAAEAQAAESASGETRSASP